jgi:hypothetical protein
MEPFLVAIGVLLGVALLVRHAIRRFVAQQKRLGRWDDKGPLVETEPPPSAPRGYGVGGMNERLEVIGEWHGKVLRDRRPKSVQPDASTSPDDKPLQ